MFPCTFVTWKQRRYVFNWLIEATGLASKSTIEKLLLFIVDLIAGKCIFEVYNMEISHGREGINLESDLKILNDV